MDYKAIEQIIKTASDNGLNYLEIETEGIHITLQKGAAGNLLGGAKSNVKEEAAEKADSVKKEVKAEVQAETVTSSQIDAEDENIKVVTSPIVGTFYSSGGPDADAFAGVGTVVKKGQTLCIIEAMKLMNEIEAEFDGEIAEVLVKDEQMVEYGQPLFKVKVS